MALPNPGMDAVPFTPLTAEFLDDMIENIESLSYGTGFQNGAITTNTLAESAVTASKIDFATFGLNIKGAFNTSAPSLSNTSQNLASSGASLSFTTPQASEAFVTVHIGIASTSDFEFRPEIRLNGVAVAKLEPAASASNGGRASVRSVSAAVSLPAGTNIISAGVTLSVGAGYVCTPNAISVTAMVMGRVTA